MRKKKWFKGKKQGTNKKGRAKFRASYQCVECGQSLSFGQVMGSEGVCPLCGHVSKGTVCDHRKVSIPIR